MEFASEVEKILVAVAVVEPEDGEDFVVPAEDRSLD